MDFLQPRDWARALAARAEHPYARAIQGGTDVMVELNFDRHRPAALLDLSQIAELASWQVDGDVVRLGAGVSYTRTITELADRLPGLAMAARTVGSAQIRNRGTVAGNVGAASPAGDSHPMLLACDAEIELESVTGHRRVAASDFYTGVKRTVLAPDELIRAVRIPVATGPQQFAKIGTRNAMVIAVTSFAVALHPSQGRVGTGIGSAAPTPRRAGDAEDYLNHYLADSGSWQQADPLPDKVITRFSELVAAAADPIDDVRGSRAYRLHALAVLARRTLTWAWDSYRASPFSTGEQS